MGGETDQIAIDGDVYRLVGKERFHIGTALSMPSL